MCILSHCLFAVQQMTGSYFLQTLHVMKQIFLSHNWKGNAYRFLRLQNSLRIRIRMKYKPDFKQPMYLWDNLERTVMEEDHSNSQRQKCFMINKLFQLICGSFFELQGTPAAISDGFPDYPYGKNNSNSHSMNKDQIIIFSELPKYCYRMFSVTPVNLKLLCLWWQSYR